MDFLYKLWTAKFYKQNAVKVNKLHRILLNILCTNVMEHRVCSHIYMQKVLHNVRFLILDSAALFTHFLGFFYEIRLHNKVLNIASTMTPFFTVHPFSKVAI
jgi:hypothetical protein